MTELTWTTAPHEAARRAAQQAGHLTWDRLDLNERNRRIALYLERLWAVIEAAERPRKKVE